MINTVKTPTYTKLQNKTRNKIMAAAEKDGRSLSGMIARILDQWAAKQ